MGIFIIALIWACGFKLYFERYEYLHPDITWAVPALDTQLIRVRGLLLWRENIVSAPNTGTCVYPLGTGPVRVPRGAVIAQVDGRDVRAYQQGYFIAGRDGQEEGWRYSELWHAGRREFDKETRVRFFENGAWVRRGQMIGKLVEQPQDLRFIGYIESREDVNEQFARERIRVRMDDDDTPSYAEVRVTRDEGDAVKFTAAMPWFHSEMLLSRNYELIVDAGQTRGVAVPMSALDRKNGETGVYMIRSSRVEFVPVVGKRIDGDKFLITKGVSVGDAVVENVAAAREGRIQLW